MNFSKSYLFSLITFMNWSLRILMIYVNCLLTTFMALSVPVKKLYMPKHSPSLRSKISFLQDSEFIFYHSSLAIPSGFIYSYQELARWRATSLRSICNVTFEGENEWKDWLFKRVLKHWKKSTFPLENQIDCVIENRFRLAADHLIWCVDFFLHDWIQSCHGFIREQFVEYWKHFGIFLIGLN